MESKQHKCNNQHVFKKWWNQTQYQYNNQHGLKESDGIKNNKNAIQSFVWKWQFPANKGRINMETNGQICANTLPPSLSFSKKKRSVLKIDNSLTQRQIALLFPGLDFSYNPLYLVSQEGLIFHFQISRWHVHLSVEVDIGHSGRNYSPCPIFVLDLGNIQKGRGGCETHFADVLELITDVQLTWPNMDLKFLATENIPLEKKIMHGNSWCLWNTDFLWNVIGEELL